MGGRLSTRTQTLATLLTNTTTQQQHPYYLTDFLSASYFDEGTFADAQAGYVFAGPGGSKSMYKLHDTRDLIPFHGGMHFVWRNNEAGDSCPNHFAGGVKEKPLRTGPMTLTSIVFSYQWPSA